MIWRFFSALSLISVLLFLSGCSSLYYFPDREELVYRDRLPLQPKDVYFKSLDGTKLHGWYFAPPDGSDPKAVIVQFHGNGENLSSHFLALYEGPAKGYAYLIFDYRGYGESEGKPFPEGVVMDGVAALRWMHDKFPQKKLIVFSQSLGGAIAFRSVQEVKKDIPIFFMVVECSLPSFREAGRSMASKSWVTYLFQPVAWLLADNSQSPEKAIHETSPIPLLVVHGTNDRVLDYKLGQKIYSLAQEPKMLWTIPGGRHLEFMFKEEGKYGEQLFLQIDELLAGKPLRSLPQGL